MLEPGGRPVTEALTTPMRPRALYLGVRPDSSGSGDQTRIQIYDIIAVDAYGRRVAAPRVNYTLISENWTYDWYQQDGRWAYHRTSHDSPIAKGVLSVGAGQPARITRRLPWGDYRLVLEDPATGARVVVRQSSGWDNDTQTDEEAPDTARLTVDNAPSHPGDTVRLHIQAPFAGEAEIAIATDHVVALRTVSIGKDGGVVSIPASAAWGGGAYLLVSVMQPRDPAAAPKPRRALGVVYVPLKPKSQVLNVTLGAPAKLESRAPIVVPLQVTGAGGGGVPRPCDPGRRRRRHPAPDPSGLA